MSSGVKFIIKQLVFLHCTPTHMTDSMTYPQIPVFSSLLTTTWCDPQRSVSSRKIGRRLVCRRRQRSAGCRGCARTATWRRATSGDRVVWKLVGASCPYMFRFTSLETRFVCASKVKTRARSCRITDQRLDCSRAVLHNRQCLQTSADVWNRAQPPQSPGLRVGGALASEAGDMWVKR